MAPKLKLGQLIESSLSTREQAQALVRMRDALRHEDLTLKRQQATADKARRAPAAVARRTHQQRQMRLLTVLHTTTDHEQLRKARADLDEIVHDPASQSPSAAAAHRECRTAAILAHHQPGRAAYWATIGPAPHCQPGDTTTALIFYRKVMNAIDRGGWTHSERSALWDLARKWQGRAHGTDLRFMVAGTWSGRLPRALEEKIRLQRSHGNGEGSSDA